MALESSLSDRLIFSKMIKISPKTLSGFCFVKMVGSCRRARKNWPIPAPRKIDPESILYAEHMEVFFFYIQSSNYRPLGFTDKTYIFGQ